MAYRQFLALTASVSLAALTAGSAIAQQAAGGTTQLEEITVQGQGAGGGGTGGPGSGAPGVATARKSRGLFFR